MTENGFKKNIIIGSGIAGITAAYGLNKKAEDFLLFEKEKRFGGTWQSYNHKGSIYELGPNTIIDKSLELRAMIKDFGLEDDCLYSELKSSKRYFYRNHDFIAISANPLGLISSKLISMGAKLRLLQELFIRSKSNANESVHDFFTRRFGEEFAKHILSPALQGVWGGDIKQLNMSVALPELYKLEHKYGSILLSMLKSPKDTKKSSINRKRTLSFKNGLEDFCNKSIENLGKEKFKAGRELISISKNPQGHFTLKIKQGQNQEFYTCENLILACPSHSSAAILKEFKPKLSQALSNIYYAPIALLAFSVKKSLFKNKLNFFDAFGFLNSDKHHFTLGTIFASKLFPERDLEDELIFLSFIGGSKNPQIIDFSELELKNIGLREIKEILNSGLGVNLELDKFEVLNTKILSRAIPQYNDNYLKQKKLIDEEIAKESNLILVGNYMNGVSIVDTVSHAILSI